MVFRVEGAVREGKVCQGVSYLGTDKNQIFGGEHTIVHTKVKILYYAGETCNVPNHVTSTNKCYEQDTAGV